ncbi:copper amine oxidase N-terminal domain-containing protein [Paenibacillus endoradicis]|uniref:copper amine oxidase N-terminal domain-containing protein n=1 Tax=Paenibacillus endoradicis TaxID=2972487 RepID=UPI00215974AB|nr:copper amine oxidase N-terminal domain-containing protein [Paenibacillus endoradicis]MCR8657182.1 copper amine oxidase N-terminal domain-containing protein [Paenibacillus endoradicis]
MRTSRKASTIRLVLVGIILLMLTGSSSWLNPQVAFAESNNVITGKNKIVFTMGSNEITFNEVKTKTEVPITVAKGVSYVQFKTIAKLSGFKVSYDSITKSSVATNKNNKITFKQGSSESTLNDRIYYVAGAPYTKDGNLMVPIKTWAEMTRSNISVNGKIITLTWDTAPLAYFSVNEQKIVAGQTKVTINDQSSSLYGFDIIAEEWIGKQTIYNELGFHTITRKVKDERGVWSVPYTVQIYVVKPNEAPIAAFVTDKNTYKLGEPVIYTNKSKDDTAIKTNNWTGNEPAFFTSGKHLVTLTIVDEEGLTSTTSKEITVLDEVLYTKDQFYLNFTEIGNKYPIDSGLALRIAAAPYTITPEDVTLVRTNSPALVMGPAIDYTDTLSGRVRFNIHKQNGAQQDLELHLIVTNENTETAYIDEDYFSAAGPSSYETTSVKTAEKRYLAQLLDNQPAKQIVLLPGQSYDLLKRDGSSAMKKNQTMTVFAEYTVPENLPLKFTLIVTEENTDEIAALTTLQQTASDTKQVRGTFENGNSVITTDKVLGSKGADKLILGDKVYDRLLQGIDAVTGKAVTNWDNDGVYYKLQLEVAPNTAIIVNPRGGKYGGSFIVNDKIIEQSQYSLLQGPNESIILHRTDNKQETVTLKFLVPPSSTMPLNFLFLPIPSLTNS